MGRLEYLVAVPVGRLQYLVAVPVGKLEDLVAVSVGRLEYLVAVPLGRLEYLVAVPVGGPESVLNVPLVPWWIGAHHCQHGDKEITTQLHLDSIIISLKQWHCRLPICFCYWNRHLTMNLRNLRIRPETSYVEKSTFVLNYLHRLLPPSPCSLIHICQ